METEIQTVENNQVSTTSEMKSLPISEMQMRIAKEKPRDEKRTCELSIRELELFPDFAEKAYYSIPYKDKASGKTVYVEGLTIKAAMAIARRWGNCVNASRISEEREDRIIVEGLFYDYEYNVLTIRQQEVSRMFRSSEGKVYRLDPNRLHLAVQSGQSKAVRNAILGSLPVALLELYKTEAKRIVSLPKKSEPTKSPKERIEDAKRAFAKTYKASQEELDKLISEYVADNDGNVTDVQMLEWLTGLWNGLQEGATSPDVVFSREAKKVSIMPTERK